jgi:hypothetical protein
MAGGIVIMRKSLLTSMCPIILFLITACAGQILTPTVLPTGIEKATQISTPMTSPDDIEKEEQAVYASFFKDNSETIVILQDTSTQWLPSSTDELQERMDYIASGLPGASRETLDNYFERNRRQPGQLSPDMQLGINYVLLSAEELSTILNQPNGWEAFYEKYSPSGYVQFSRVGFNGTLDQAIIYVGSVPGAMMGSGNYYLMEKMGGQWVIKEQVLAWVS